MSASRQLLDFLASRSRSRAVAHAAREAAGGARAVSGAMVYRVRRWWRSPAGVAALTVAGLLAVLGLSTWQRIRFEEAQAIEAAYLANDNLAIAYEESVDNAFGDLEQLFRLVETEYREEGSSVSHAMSRWPLDRELVRGMAIVDAQGATVVAIGEAGRASGLLRESIGTASAQAAQRIRIGTPATLELDGRKATRFTVSRRIDRADGSYLGTVVAILDPGFFTRFFRRLHPDTGGMIALIRSDGIGIARQAGTSTRFDDDMRSSTLFARLAAAPDGQFMSRGVREGVPRLVSYRSLARYSLAVMAGTGVTQALAPVRERARLYFALAGAASALIVLAALGILGSVQRRHHDFEALRRTEAKLRETAARKDAIAESMAGGVIISSLDGTILSVNRAACDMHGYARGELVGMPLSRLLAEADRAGFAERLRTAAGSVAGAEHEVKEVRALRKDGSLFEAEVIGSVVAWDGSANLVGIVHDITERKATERALRRSEALYRATFDQALLGIIHTGMDGRFIRVNRKACEMLGYTQAQMLALGYRDVTHPEDLVESARRHQALLGDPLQHFEFQMTRRYLRKDGSIVWTLASVSVIRGEGGMPDFFLTMVQDISELKRVEQMQNEFISTVSHELRSPLTSIRASLGLLVGGVAGELPKAARELAAIGERNCERLIRLVNDILDTERMESGRMRFELQATDLRVLASRAVESMQGLAVGRGVQLRLAAPEYALGANVDADRFIEVLTNLVSNAVKFSPAASTVEIALSAAGGRVRLEVRDHGPGIPKDFESRIFQRFAQADSTSTRAQGGTGLGLYIAHEIVKRLGGTIGYDTKPGAGTTFHVELPQVRLEETQAELELHA